MTARKTATSARGSKSATVSKSGGSTNKSSQATASRAKPATPRKKSQPASSRPKPATPRNPSRHGRPPAAFSAVSLFAGCGGLDLGAERTGKVKTVWAVDSDPWAVATYRRNLGQHIWEKDVREVEFPDVPCDILLAGPPCQDFSSLWNHDGAKTARGNLYRQVARFLDQRQPLAFVLENVPGLLSANHGEAWLLVRHALRAPSMFLYGEPGPRYEISVQLVDFADLGVPQRRQRLIVMGVRRDIGLRPPEIPRPYESEPLTVGDALDEDPLPDDAPNHEVGFDSDDVIERLKLIRPGENYTNVPKGHPLAVKGLISHVYRRLDPAKPAYTVIASGGGGTHGYHHIHPRRLSNRERARLQSFPDDFFFEGGTGKSNYPRIRRQIGNAVPPAGAEIIVNALVSALRAAKVSGTSSREITEARRRVATTNNTTS